MYYQAHRLWSRRAVGRRFARRGEVPYIRRHGSHGAGALETIEPTWQMWASFAVIGVAVVAYAAERWAMELTSAATILALMLIFQWGGEGAPGPKAFLAGFAAPALITILALMVVGQGLIRTGSIEALVMPLVNRLRLRPVATGALLFLAVALLSAFINNTPVVVIFIPIATALAARADVPAARWMMGLSFAAILGGMTTLIGSSTNLLVAGAAAAQGGPVIGFFDFALMGTILAAIGIAYLLAVAPRLLPDRESLTRQYMGEGRHYVAQITVRESSRLIGERAVAGRFPALADMTVRLFQRGPHVVLPPYDDIEIQVGDVLVVAATREVLAQALANTPSLLPPDGEMTASDQLLVEAMVAPTSRLVGRAVAEIGFHYQTDCLVLGVQRRSRMLRASLDVIRLEVGDVLLLLGPRERVRDLRADADVVLLEWSARELTARRKAPLAGIIFVGIIALATTDALPLVMVALLGAVAMLASGCLTPSQAARAIDRRVALLVPAALAMGTALAATGGAEWLAHNLVGQVSGFGPVATLSVLFALVAVATNLISNNATAVLFTPIAIAVAANLGVSEVAFVHAVIFAANCSFATPIGYQTNLLVMGPGHYRFADFLRAGVPLAGLLWLAFSLLAPILYGL